MRVLVIGLVELLITRFDAVHTPIVMIIILKENA